MGRGDKAQDGDSVLVSEKAGGGLWLMSADNHNAWIEADGDSLEPVKQ